MSAVVIDSSAFVDTIFDPYGLGQRVLDNLENFDAWWAPEVFDAEVAQSLRHQWMRGLLTKLELTRQITPFPADHDGCSYGLCARSPL